MKFEALFVIFSSAFGGPGRPRVALAPGRVNLIGEHTDYNQGFVLPMAIEREVAVAFRPRADRRLRVLSVDFRETCELEIDALRPPGGHLWRHYVAGVAWALRESGLRLRGLDAVIGGDVPVGAGLSSSAALETAVARALCDVAEAPWDSRAMAIACRRAENEYVGVGCGIMDQIAAGVSRQGCALLLDCRSLAGEFVELPAAASVVVMDTGVRRALALSAYNERRAECEAAVRAARELRPEVEALRDVDEMLLQELRARLPRVVASRAQHVVAEIARPGRLASALGRSDLASAGRLLYESHESLRDLYEVSCAELDLIVDLAQRHPACFGARMTGAGFGGCAVALVASEAADSFTREVGDAYRVRTQLPGTLFASRPAAGARVLD